jgi:ABC-2 type transport system permease protein
VPCLALALFFLLAFVRNETDEGYRRAALAALGVAGGLMTLIGVIGGLMSDTFLLGQGVVMLLLGLFYLLAFIVHQPVGSDRGYYLALGLGVVGVLMMLISLGYLLLPGWFGWVRWTPGRPGGPVLYFYAGLEYALLALGLCSDAKLIVMTRRELAAFFYSPIAYVVLVAAAVLGWLQYWFFLDVLIENSRGLGLLEPIVADMFFSLIPVLAVICAVPIITMRLLSEEQRSGTLEMLLTAPVNEWQVVLSKFLAALRFYLLIWYPWALYLVALRVEGGEEFDYRPLLSFLIVFVVTGANFVAMGLFFSALTRNQIAAAILTVMGMLVLTVIYMFRGLVTPGGALATILTYVSYLNLWATALQGNLAPRFLLFHVSAMVLWLFLAVKVLESRKWR